MPGSYYLSVVFIVDMFVELVDPGATVGGAGPCGNVFVLSVSSYEWMVVSLVLGASVPP